MVRIASEGRCAPYTRDWSKQAKDCTYASVGKRGGTKSCRMGVMATTLQTESNDSPSASADNGFAYSCRVRRATASTLSEENHS